MTGQKMNRWEFYLNGKFLFAKAAYDHFIVVEGHRFTHEGRVYQALTVNDCRVDLLDRGPMSFRSE